MGNAYVKPCFGNVSAGGEDICGVSWSGFLIG